MFLEMSVDASGNKLFLAFSTLKNCVSQELRGGVWEHSLTHFYSSPREAYNAGVNNGVFGVCFVCSSGTLVICTRNLKSEMTRKPSSWLLSLSYQRGVWVKCDQESVDVSGSIHLAEISGSLLLFGQLFSNVLRVMQLRNHKIECVAPINFQEHFRTFDARVVNGDTLVALVSDQDPVVRLLQLNLGNKSLHQLACIEMFNARKILWCKEQLHAGIWNAEEQNYSVFELRLSNNPYNLTPEKLFNRHICCWCAINDNITIIE